MKLYTRTGDDGSTGLHGGGRVSKTDLRVETYGDCDELNSVIGLARVATENGTLIAEVLDELQRLLFEIGADLATPTASKGRDKVSPVTDDDIERLEGWIDASTEAVEPLKTFVLPGGSEQAARLHHARTVCRRTERAVVRLMEAEADAVAVSLLAYVNRAGDLLFALARLANYEAGIPDVPWHPRSRDSG